MVQESDLAAPERPRWTVPAVVSIAAFSALTYSWASTRGSLEIYYEAAVRSMAANWHDFFYGAFDPAGTVSLDKLPGAFWLQALSVRVFGFHEWAILLPQVLEGVATVVVLYLAVSRLAGPIAGVVAAAVLAITPATVALNRGNISDSFLILALVLAAHACAIAATTGRFRWLLLSGFWVGVAFQAKMLEAWLVIPAIGLVWLVAAPGGPLRRVLQLGGMGVVVAAVSLSWMTAVSLFPQGGRPYVDGSSHDSLFQQVFSYNGFNKFGSGGAGLGPTGASFSSLVDFRLPGSAGVFRLLSGAGGRDIAWLIPVAVVAGVAILFARRGYPRRDPLRAAAIFWSAWLVVFFVAFSALSALNAYYLAALSPAVGALCGLGVEWAIRSGLNDGRVVAAVLTAAAMTLGYGLWLSDSPAVRTGGGWLAAMLMVAAAGLLAAGRDHSVVLSRTGLGVACGVAGLLSLFAAWDIVGTGLGPFDTPYEPASVKQVTEVDPKAALAAIRPQLPVLRQANGSDRYLAATYTSILAASLIIDTGQEVEPIGGFSGSAPSPSLPALAMQVDAGQLQTIIATPTDDARIAWVRSHCLKLPTASDTAATGPIRGIVTYYCVRGT